uniref:Reverse transcriptase domain-containing protein n=1 Tax=Micrurus spixii TaxID=129469 RepID=A0A2D4LSV4_9SAUR
MGKTKMIITNMTGSQKDELEKVTGCEIVKKVKYLGVYISAVNGKLYKNNYETLWSKIQTEMDTWKKLQLSLLGRIAVIKMNVLPKFLFLFQMILVIKRESDLMEWQKGINKYVWQGKKPRIKMKIMQDARERGGLKMPNLKLYYDATVLAAISDWINLTNEKIMNIEGYGLLYGWHAYLVYNQKADKTFKSHTLRNSLLRVWKKYQGIMDHKIPIWAVPRHAIENISIEQRQDVVTYKELLRLTDGVLQLKSLNVLKEEGFVQTWFQYMQLQNRWQKDQKFGLA